MDDNKKFSIREYREKLYYEIKKKKKLIQKKMEMQQRKNFQWTLQATYFSH